MRQLRTLFLFLCVLPTLIVAQEGVIRTASGASSAQANAALASNVTEFFVFGFGTGAAGDTTYCTDSTNYGSFYNKTDTLSITSLNVILLHGIGADTVMLDIMWDDTLNGVTHTHLNTSGLGCNSTTVGTLDVSFNNAKIPPGFWVWAKTTTTVGRKPTAMYATLSGKRIKI